jgi:GNAT superfamily N-acetyltransferase
MDLRPLSEVELREALAPINRPTGIGQAGQLGKTVRTPAQLRERAAAQVLDLKLSRACFIGDGLCGAALVDRVGDHAHIDALAVEPLAQQRGAGKALLDSIVTAAAAAGVKRLSFFGSDFDNVLPPILTHLGFGRGRNVARFTLPGPPAALPLPREVEADAPPDGEGPFARPLPLSNALPVVHEGLAADKLCFAQQAEVLSRLCGQDKLVAYVSALPGQPQPHAAVIYERERKLILALHGDTAHLAPLLCLLATRHGVNAVDALVEGHPAEAALAAAGYQRAAVRVEWWKDLG